MLGRHALLVCFCVQPAAHIVVNDCVALGPTDSVSLLAQESASVLDHTRFSLGRESGDLGSIRLQVSR